MRLRPVRDLLGEDVEEFSVELAAGGVVVVTGQANDAFVADGLNALAGFGAIADHIAGAQISVDAFLLQYFHDRVQRVMIAVNVAQWGGGVEVAKRLEVNDIIVNYNMLPGDTDPRNPSGLRIGVPEMTRFGMDERAMGELAQLIHDAVRGKDVKEAVHELRGRFTEMKYV